MPARFPMKGCHGSKEKPYPISGCRCMRCVARLLYRRRWMRDQYQLNTAYQERKRSRYRRIYRKSRLSRLMYEHLKRLAMADGLWIEVKRGRGRVPENVTAA